MKYNGFYFWMFKSPMKKILAEKYGREYAAGIMNVMMEKDIRMGLWERKFQFLLRSYHWRMPMMR